MIEVTDREISPERLVNEVRNPRAGCVVTYVGLIRGYSQGKPVLSVTYKDPGNAVERLKEIAMEAQQKWHIEDIAMAHRTGELKVGDINLVVAIASAHRGEGLAACKYVIDQFKERLPTQKMETYRSDRSNDKISHKKVKEIDEEKADLKARWPVYSVPLRMWQELEDLEAELERAKQTKDDIY